MQSIMSSGQCTGSRDYHPPEFQDLFSAGGQEAGALVGVEADQVDLALNGVQQQCQAVCILQGVVHLLQHHVLDEHRPLPSLGEPLLQSSQQLGQWPPAMPIYCSIVYLGIRSSFLSMRYTALYRNMFYCNLFYCMFCFF